MSNLGAYQWITAKSKKVGGPVNLLLLTGAGAIAVWEGSKWVVKRCADAITNYINKKANVSTILELYTVKLDDKSNEGIEFCTGDQFRVLEIDGDAALIEKMGNSGNPYFVSVDLLRRISNYK